MHALSYTSTVMSATDARTIRAAACRTRGHSWCAYTVHNRRPTHHTYVNGTAAGSIKHEFAPRARQSAACAYSHVPVLTLAAQRIHFGRLAVRRATRRHR